MTDKKKSRLSMLDSLAGAGVSAPPPPMMSSNRALRSARDAVDGHNIWELDPATIRDNRMQDRMDIGDVSDLRQSIEQNGQAVPILVRRDPENADKYLLVYGRRRLTAIRQSQSVTTVRALVASMNEDASIRAQAAENSERRDLSYMEKALYARSLLEVGYGTQDKVAEVLNVTKSWISMANSILRIVETDLARLIGPAPTVGRPRWDALAQTMDRNFSSRAPLIEVAQQTRARVEQALENGQPPEREPSLIIFEAVEKAAQKTKRPRSAPRPPAPQKLILDGAPAGRVRRTSNGLALDLTDTGFADWLGAEAQDILSELHARYAARRDT